MAKKTPKVIKSGNNRENTKNPTPAAEKAEPKAKRTKTQAKADRQLKVQIDAEARDLMYDDPSLSMEEARSEIIARRYKLDDPKTGDPDDTYEAREAAVDPANIVSADTNEARIADTTEFSDLENTGENAQTEAFDPTAIRGYTLEEDGSVGKEDSRSYAHLPPEERVAKLAEQRLAAGAEGGLDPQTTLPADLRSTTPRPGRTPRRSLFSRRGQVAKSYVDTLDISEEAAQGKLDSNRRSAAFSVGGTPLEEGEIGPRLTSPIYNDTDPRRSATTRTPEETVMDRQPGTPGRSVGGNLILGRRFRGRKGYNQTPDVVAVNEDNATRALIGNVDLAIQNAMRTVGARPAGPRSSGADLTVEEARTSPELRGVLQQGSMGGVLSTQQDEDVTQMVGSFTKRDNSARTSGTMPAEEADAASRETTRVVPKLDANGNEMKDPRNADVTLTELANPRVAPRPAAFPEEGLALPSIFGGGQFRMTPQFLQARNDEEARMRARATSGRVKDADFAASPVGQEATARAENKEPLPHTMVPNPAFTPVDEQGMPYEEGPEADAERIGMAEEMARGRRTTGRSFRVRKTGRTGESRNRDFVSTRTPGQDEYYPTKPEYKQVIRVAPGSATRQYAKDENGKTILDERGKPIPLRDAEGKPIVSAQETKTVNEPTGRRVADYGSGTAVGPDIVKEATAALRESNGGMTEDEALEGATLFTAAEDETQKSLESEMVHQGQTAGISDHGDVSRTTSSGKNPLPKDITERKVLIPSPTGGSTQVNIIDPERKINKKVLDPTTGKMVNQEVSQLIEHVTAGITDPEHKARIAAGFTTTTNDPQYSPPKEDEFGVEIDNETEEEANPLDTGVDKADAKMYKPTFRTHPLTGSPKPEFQDTGSPRKDKVQHEAALAEWSKYNIGTIDRSPEALQKGRDAQEASRIAERDQKLADSGNSPEALQRSKDAKAADIAAGIAASTPEAIAANAEAAKADAAKRKEQNDATARRQRENPPLEASAPPGTPSREELAVAERSNRPVEEVMASPAAIAAARETKPEATGDVEQSYGRGSKIRTAVYPQTVASGAPHPSAGQIVRTRSGEIVQHDDTTHTPRFDDNGSFTHLESKLPAYEQKIEPITLSRVSPEDRFRIETANKLLAKEGKPAVVATSANRGVPEPGVEDHGTTFGAIPGIVPPSPTVTRTLSTTHVDLPGNENSPGMNVSQRIVRGADGEIDRNLSGMAPSMDVPVANPRWHLGSQVRVGQPAVTTSGVSAPDRPIATQRQEAYSRLRRRPGQPMEGQPMPRRAQEGIIVQPTGYIHPALTRDAVARGANSGRTESRPAFLAENDRKVAEGTFVTPDATAQPINANSRRVAERRFGAAMTDTADEAQTRINSAMGGGQFNK